MKTQLIASLRMLLVMIILTGIAYPLFMTGLAQLTYPARANGSLVMKAGRIVGSELIGQQFDSPIYLWSRPSAINYNPIPSGASNLGPASYKLAQQIADRRDLFLKGNLLADETIIPKEMIFASASGLDPHISPEAALLQLERVATARHYTQAQKEQFFRLIKSKIEEPQFFIFGERRINVFELNLELDKIR